MAYKTAAPSPCWCRTGPASTRSGCGWGKSTRRKADSPTATAPDSPSPNLAYNQQARVVVQDTDRYGRMVSRVYVGGTDVNAEMVRQGAAWVYRQFAKDPSLYRLEADARAAR